MTLEDKIRAMIQDNSIMLFMKGTPTFPQCGFSGQAVYLLRQCGAKDFGYFNVLEADEIRQGIKEFSQWPTIPQLYVNGEFVGGSDIMKELFEKGELKQLIEKVLA